MSKVKQVQQPQIPSPQVCQPAHSNLSGSQNKPSQSKSILQSINGSYIDIDIDNYHEMEIDNNSDAYYSDSEENESDFSDESDLSDGSQIFPQINYESDPVSEEYVFDSEAARRAVMQANDTLIGSEDGYLSDQTNEASPTKGQSSIKNNSQNLEYNDQSLGDKPTLHNAAQGVQNQYKNEISSQHSPRLNRCNEQVPIQQDLQIEQETQGPQVDQKQKEDLKNISKQLAQEDSESYKSTQTKIDVKQKQKNEKMGLEKGVEQQSTEHVGTDAQKSQNKDDIQEVQDIQTEYVLDIPDIYNKNTWKQYYNHTDEDTCTKIDFWIEKYVQWFDQPSSKEQEVQVQKELLRLEQEQTLKLQQLETQHYGTPMLVKNNQAPLEQIHSNIQQTQQIKNKDKGVKTANFDNYSKHTGGTDNQSNESIYQQEKILIQSLNKGQWSVKQNQNILVFEVGGKLIQVDLKDDISKLNIHQMKKHAMELLRLFLSIKQSKQGQGLINRFQYQSVPKPQFWPDGVSFDKTWSDNKIQTSKVYSSLLKFFGSFKK